MRFEESLEEVLGELGVTPDATQLQGLCEHFELLQKWNRHINLTALSDPREVARRHFGEAAFLHRELPAMASAVDVGSGAGFPGLPFALLRPETAVALVDSKRKKASFLQVAARAHRNVSVCCCRIEDWGGQAEWALIRAVAPATVLPALCGRSTAVAVLGTDRPPAGSFGPWQAQRMPWSDKRYLWTAEGEIQPGG